MRNSGPLPHPLLDSPGNELRLIKAALKIPFPVERDRNENDFFPADHGKLPDLLGDNVPEIIRQLLRKAVFELTDRRLNSGVSRVIQAVDDAIEILKFRIEARIVARIEISNWFILKISNTGTTQKFPRLSPYSQ